MAEWGVFWTAAGTLGTLLFGSIGLYKIYHELVRLNEQRMKDIADKEISAKLKRTEFFLSQHRRLFDDKDLYAVLCLIDADDAELAKPEMADKKRKFLTFLEEIALLENSNQIDSNVAFYMFGYYALCVRYGSNFAEDIDMSEANWGLFYSFSRRAEDFRNIHTNGPPMNMSL
jgi:hypothetical protein